MQNTLHHDPTISPISGTYRAKPSGSRVSPKWVRGRVGWVWEVPGPAAAGGCPPLFATPWGDAAEFSFFIPCRRRRAARLRLRRQALPRSGSSRMALCPASGGLRTSGIDLPIVEHAQSPGRNAPGSIPGIDSIEGHPDFLGKLFHGQKIAPSTVRRRQTLNEAREIFESLVLRHVCNNRLSPWLSQTISIDRSFGVPIQPRHGHTGHTLDRDAEGDAAQQSTVRRVAGSLPDDEASTFRSGRAAHRPRAPAAGREQRLSRMRILADLIGAGLPR